MEKKNRKIGPVRRVITAVLIVFRLIFVPTGTMLDYYG